MSGLKNKWWFYFPVILSIVTGCFSPRPIEQITARKYQQHKLFEDTSFVYQLPYESGTKHRVIQEYFSRFTHKYKAATDFRMKKGTPVLASRDGIVTRIKDDSNMGGFNKKYRADANFVIIDHGDSTRASYRHLQYKSVLVLPGQLVTKGQLIGLSGNTGYTFTPHLHFMVSEYLDGTWTTIPVRFESSKFIGYLQPLHRYQSANSLQGSR
ncbi:MAG: M23 family metallopeptidase [Saprospiraceae bacterium]